MTRRILRAVYWPAVILTAAVAASAATVPFTGTDASVAAVTAAAAVVWVGLHLEPHRKDGQ